MCSYCDDCDVDFLFSPQILGEDAQFWWSESEKEKIDKILDKILGEKIDI